MWQEIIEKIIGWVVPFLLGSAVSFFLIWKKWVKAIVVGIQCLLRAEIIRQHEKWTKLRYCPLYAKEALTREYKVYHNLGGNDVATALYDEVMDLPEWQENQNT